MVCDTTKTKNAAVDMSGLSSSKLDIFTTLQTLTLGQLALRLVEVTFHFHLLEHVEGTTEKSNHILLVNFVCLTPLLL